MEKPTIIIEGNTTIIKDSSGQTTVTHTRDGQVVITTTNKEEKPYYGPYGDAAPSDR